MDVPSDSSLLTSLPRRPEPRRDLPFDMLSPASSMPRAPHVSPAANGRVSAQPMLEMVTAIPRPRHGLLPLPEAARALGVNRSTVYRARQPQERSYLGRRDQHWSIVAVSRKPTVFVETVDGGPIDAESSCDVGQR